MTANNGMRPVNRITAILHGQRSVTANTALRLVRYFRTTPQVWLNLQKIHEMRRAEIAVGHRVAACVKPWCSRQRRPGVAGSGQSRVDAGGRSGRVTTATPRSVSAPDVLRGNGSR